MFMLLYVFPFAKYTKTEALSYQKELPARLQYSSSYLLLPIYTCVVVVIIYKSFALSKCSDTGSTGSIKIMY
jgi:hypothetical protein